MEIAYVTAAPIPRPRYQVPASFGQVQDMVVDITAKANGKIINCSMLPAQQDVADSSTGGESITVASSKEAMNAEILNLKQKSADILSSVEYHKGMLVTCDQILSDLNPEFAEKQAQREELDRLKSQMEDMTRSMSELMETNRKLIEKLKSE